MQCSHQTAERRSRRNNIARLETDGRVDRTLNLSTVGSYVTAIAIQPDGKILIGGLFSNILGSTRNHIARLNTDGTLDTAFNPNANGIVYSIAVQADGKILVGGAFNGASSIGGQTRNHIARLNATNGLADSFNPNANGQVFSIAVQADGKILVGGGFTERQHRRTGAQPHRPARSPRLGLADSFNPNANGQVYSIAVQADGKILAGGEFSGANSIGGQTRNRIARLDATTGLADSFNPSANGNVNSVAVQADGKILAGGDFTHSIGGQTRNYIARLDATTGLADSFNPNANSEVLSIAVQADGKILAGGFFTERTASADRRATTSPGSMPRPAWQIRSTRTRTILSFQSRCRRTARSCRAALSPSIGGQTRSLFARLTNDTVALQDLAVTQTTITWTRGGSSPQFARVTFESSTDNVNYTPLGNGTASGAATGP